MRVLPPDLRWGTAGAAGARPRETTFRIDYHRCCRSLELTVWRGIVARRESVLAPPPRSGVLSRFVCDAVESCDALFLPSPRGEGGFGAKLRGRMGGGEPFGFLGSCLATAGVRRSCEATPQQPAGLPPTPSPPFGGATPPSRAGKNSDRPRTGDGLRSCRTSREIGHRRGTWPVGSEGTPPSRLRRCSLLRGEQNQTQPVAHQPRYHLSANRDRPPKRACPLPAKNRYPSPLPVNGGR